MSIFIERGHLTRKLFQREANMSKSTPLNQLPAFSDSQLMDEDETINEVMGDLASSIPGFEVPNVVQPNPNPNPNVVPYKKELEKPEKTTPTWLDKLVPESISEQLWFGGLIAIIFILVSLAPIEAILKTQPAIAAYAGPYSAIALRAIIMGLATVIIRR